MAAPIRAVEPPDDDVDLRFVAAVVRGNLRLLAGMVRANRPWRLLPHLTTAFAAALAVLAYALLNQTIWQLAQALGTWRMTFASLVAIGCMIAWLIIEHEMWERPDEPAERDLVALFNAATVVTLFIGGLPALGAFGAGFLVNTTWDPVKTVFGGAVPIYGTLITAVLAILLPSLLTAPPQPACCLLHRFTGALDLGDRRDHREQDPHRAVARRPQHRRQLRVEQPALANDLAGGMADLLADDVVQMIGAHAEGAGVGGHGVPFGEVLLHGDLEFARELRRAPVEDEALRFSRASTPVM